MSLDASLDVTVADEVEFVMSVENTGTQPVELTFRTGQPGDVTVRKGDTGEQIWRWSEGKMFTQAIQTATIRAGESRDFEFVWADPPRGLFEATVELKADRSITATRTFSV